MCLFPGMMGGQSQQNVNAPPEAKKQQCNLYILAIAHFVLAITMCVAIPGPGFGEIMAAMILICTAHCMNYCMLIFYMFMAMFDIVQYFSAVGLLIQQGQFGPCYRNENPKYCNPFSVTMVLIFLVFSMVALGVAFYAYRVFKAYAMGQLANSGGGNGMFLRGMNMPVGGRGGQRAGGDDEDDERPRYEAPQSTQPPANNNNAQYTVSGGGTSTQAAPPSQPPGPNRGGYTAFGGQGVRIG